MYINKKNFCMIFPGHGAQSVGMLNQLAKDYPIIKQTFYEASDYLGYDLWKLIEYGPKKILNQSQKTQPMLVTSAVAVFRLWQSQGGGMPTVLIGHSVGEYSALVCAGAISFKECVSLVELRGQLMQNACSENYGLMAAIIGLNKDTIINICKYSALDETVTPVIFNSPTQIVIAGHKRAVTRASITCKNKGAKVRFLMNIPFHCALLKPISNLFRLALKKITVNKPLIPVINNVDVKCEICPSKIRYALMRQLYKPVRWIECIQHMKKYNVRTVIEIGTNHILTGITKKIDPKLMIIAINNSENLLAALQ